LFSRRFAGFWDAEPPPLLGLGKSCPQPPFVTPPADFRLCRPIVHQLFPQQLFFFTPRFTLTPNNPLSSTPCTPLGRMTLTSFSTPYKATPPCTLTPLPYQPFNTFSLAQSPTPPSLPGGFFLSFGKRDHYIFLMAFPLSPLFSSGFLTHFFFLPADPSGRFSVRTPFYHITPTSSNLLPYRFFLILAVSFFFPKLQCWLF